MTIVKKILATSGVAIVMAMLALPAASAQSQQDLQAQINAMKLQLEAMQRQIEASGEKVNEKTDEKTNEKTDEKTAAGSLAGDAIEVKWEPAPSIKSPDGRFEMNMRGRILADSAWLSDRDGNMNVKAAEFRAARIGIEGRAWKDIKYSFEVDFAGNEASVKGAYIQWSSPLGVALTVGQTKMPNSLDEQTSGRHTSLMERASFTDAFGFSRRMGLSISGGGDNWTAKFGVYRGSSGIDGEDKGTELAGRITYSPRVGEVQTHFGGSFRSRTAGDQSNFRYRQRPHLHLSSEHFVDTGAIANKDFFYGIEAAAIAGPLWAAAEYGWLKADTDNPLIGNPTFSGGYGEVGYFLTGESRGYKAGKGAWDRPKVNNPVFTGGIGAWAVVARFDSIDLGDTGIQGGKQNSYILGVNWYLNRHTRMMVNYSHAIITRAFSVSLNGIDGRNSVNGFGIRAQVDW